MMVVRAAAAADGAALRRLLAQTAQTAQGAGMAEVERVFVVEDLRNGLIVATTRLRSAIGLDLPRYGYHVGCVVHAVRELRLFQRQRTLYLSNDHTGASELCDIAVESAGLALADQAAALSLVVQAALLWIAGQRGDYAARLVAQLPGVRDAADQSPFWAGLGRHFFAGDPAEAAKTHGPGWSSHVAALMPRQPIYASFLPPAAQSAIAQAHPEAQALREVLESEGLRYGHHIDIVDGGPLLEAATDDLPAVAASRTWEAAAGTPASGWRRHLVLGAEPLRAARVSALPQGALLLMAPQDLQRLSLVPGQRVRALPARG